MADPKSTFRIRFGGSANSTIGSETRIYTDLVAHANSYANNFSANNLTISNANNILVSGNTLPDYIVSIAGEAGTGTGTGGGGTTVLVETESVPFNYNSNTTAKANGAVVNFIFEEHPGKTGEVLTNPFTITVSSNNLILDPEGSFLSAGDTITFLSVIANLRLISNGSYWYLSGDNTLTTVAVSNNYLQTQLGGGGDVSNNYLTSTFTSNNYLQSQGYGTGDVSNNYLQAQGYLTTETGDVSNNYLQAQSYGTGDVSNNYIQGRFTSNTFIISTFASNSYVQDTVSTEVAALVNAAPSTLDTLNELAAALGDDPNFATTVSNQIGIRSTNTYVNSTFSSNSYLQSQLGGSYREGEIIEDYYVPADGRQLTTVAGTANTEQVTGTQTFSNVQEKITGSEITGYKVPSGTKYVNFGFKIISYSRKSSIATSHQVYIYYKVNGGSYNIVGYHGGFGDYNGPVDIDFVFEVGASSANAQLGTITESTPTLDFKVETIGRQSSQGAVMHSPHGSQPWGTPPTPGTFGYPYVYVKSIAGS